MGKHTLLFIVLFSLWLRPGVAAEVALSHGRLDAAVAVATVRGIINPVSAEYLIRSIDAAEKGGDYAFVIQLDTPGGLDTSMREIIQHILGSKIPVIVYVAPAGARAASAGTFIGLSAHILAMAPNTSIGAASPVQMGGPGAGSEKPDKTLMRKVTQDAASYIRSLAQERRRNVNLAEQTVLRGRSFNQREAVQNGLCDVTAESLTELLQKLEGRSVQGKFGVTALRFSGRAIDLKEMALRENILFEISNPNIAYILMIIGIYGMIFELSNPGLIFPGVIGAIALILALFSLGNLTVNLTGILLILLAVVFFVIEIFVVPNGILAAGGILALILGSLVLFNVETPYGTLKISRTLIAGVATFSAFFFFFIVSAGVRALRRKVESGVGGLVGKVGMAKTDLLPTGIVLVEGEDWNAESIEGNISKESKIKVADVQGLTAKVRRL